MLTTKQKPLEQIMGYLDKEKNIFLLGCKGCAEGCHTGGEKEVLEMKQKLEGAGKTVTGTSLIDFMCNEGLVRATLTCPRKQNHSLRLIAGAVLRSRRTGDLGGSR